MDLDVRIVTTFNPKNWGDFVRRNLESMLDFLPYEVVAYHEDEQPELEHPRLVWRRFEEIPGAVEFCQEAGKFPPARGDFAGRYDYNFDAFKFARKVYAQCDAAAEAGDVLIWLDADVEVLAPLSVGAIETLLSGMPMAIYARPWLHTETGIVFFDLRHEATQEFLRHYRHLYESRRVYTLPHGWHDCWAMDAVIEALGLAVVNLNRRGPGQYEVVSTSELASIFRHDKGARKHAA
jgi:hypothetical protein